MSFASSVSISEGILEELLGVYVHAFLIYLLFGVLNTRRKYFLNLKVLGVKNMMEINGWLKLRRNLVLMNINW